MNLFDYIQQQLALEKIDLGSAYLAIPLDVQQGLSTKQIDGVATIFRGLIKNKTTRYTAQIRNSYPRSCGE